jgi:hypothetical protein
MQPLHANAFQPCWYSAQRCLESRDQQDATQRELGLRTMCFATSERVLCVMLPLSAPIKNHEPDKGSALITTLLLILPCQC